MPAQTTTILAVPGKQEILITREFDAPRELVFKAFTEPLRIMRGTISIQCSLDNLVFP